MKIKLILERKQGVQYSGTVFTVNELMQLDNSCCEEIDMGDVADYVVERDKFLDAVAQKLVYGGTLIMSGTDLTSVSRAYYVKEMALGDAVKKLYGGRHSISSYLDMYNWFNSKGLAVIRTERIKHEYSFVVERPSP